MSEHDEAPRRLLVADDEEAISSGLALNLRRKGYEVTVVADGGAALAAVRAARQDAGVGSHGFDLVLLDVRMPVLDGFEVCQRLRQEGDFTPILMLTARSQPDDVVYGLKLGADDYVTKPFDLAELLARVEGLLRRHAWSRAAAGNGNSGAGGDEADERPSGVPTAMPRLTFGDFWVDFATWQALTRQGVVELSQKEVAVMRMFAARPLQVITRRELLAEVWELPHHPNTRVVDNVIVALRKAFEENAWRPRHIQSVRGAGYRFVP